MLQVKLLERELGVVTVPIWTKRTHPRIQLADLGSKQTRDSDEWGVDRTLLKNIFKYFNVQPSVDAFAVTNNTIFLDSFFSKYPQQGSLGVNFFTQILKPDIVFFCMSAHKIDRTSN